ncbi:MAG: phosphatase PAP2 family protein [Hyphomonas sp.]|nr:phosphatase PAP2 family protein [Hyphomonas sp.]
MTDHSLTRARLPAIRLPWLKDEARLMVPVFCAVGAWLVLSTFVKAFVHGTMGGAASPTGSYYDYAIRNSLMFFQAALVIGAIRLAFGILRSGDPDYLSKMIDRARANALRLPVLFVAGIASFGLFMTAYSTFKARIALMHPFAWDQRLADWDKALFLGHDPWTAFSWVYSSPALLRSVDFLYDLWAVLLVGSWMSCFVLTGLGLQRRIRYCLALLATWFVGGNLMALGLSSAGPCYYDYFGAQPGRFDGLFAHLNALPGLRAPDMQAMLWNTFVQDGIGIGGISAAPSMHCATAFLFVLMFGRTPLWRAVTGAYFAIILCGSVILGWHYLLDGLIGAPVAAACWWACGYLSRRIAPAEGC